MIVFAIGLVVGLVWGSGACFAMLMLGWRGPFPVVLVFWPVLLGLDVWNARKGRKGLRP